MADKIVQFPTFNISLGDAILLVKHHLDDPDYALQSKVLAIERVANMETHNSVTKDELVSALRWLFEHYEFGGGTVNDMRLIDADEIEELFYKQAKYGATDLMDAFDDALQDAQTIIPNCPTDCRWSGIRYQRCSCCARNYLNMKDGYERKDGDGDG